MCLHICTQNSDPREWRHAACWQKSASPEAPRQADDRFAFRASLGPKLSGKLGARLPAAVLVHTCVPRSIRSRTEPRYEGCVARQALCNGAADPSILQRHGNTHVSYAREIQSVRQSVPLASLPTELQRSLCSAEYVGDSVWARVRTECASERACGRVCALYEIRSCKTPVE
jgi:hypothetical protein